jgi:hypothetical protein
MADDFVAFVAVFSIFFMPVAGWIVVRWLGHRERMEMIRHGMAPNARVRGRDWRNAAQAMPPPVPPFAGNPSKQRSYDDDFSDAAQRIVLRRGIRLTFIGVAITIGLSFIGYHDEGPLGPTWHPGPWLLGGLIPTCIGLSQVVTAILSGATLGPGPMQGPPYGGTPYAGPLPEAPFAPPPPPGTRPNFDTPYTYRPGDTSELRPPPMPPERR